VSLLPHRHHGPDWTDRPASAELFMSRLTAYRRISAASVCGGSWCAHCEETPLLPLLFHTSSVELFHLSPRHCACAPPSRSPKPLFIACPSASVSPAGQSKTHSAPAHYLTRLSSLHVLITGRPEESRSTSTSAPARRRELSSHIGFLHFCHVFSISCGQFRW
jgi:hypothetical protein